MKLGDTFTLVIGVVATILAIATLAATIACNIRRLKECFGRGRRRRDSYFELPTIEPAKRMSYRLELDIDQNRIGPYTADWNIKGSRFHRISES